MAKLVDILQQERDRDTADKWGIIHLYKTGSFYSAYEWSAWLIAAITFNDKVRMATKDRKPIVVTRIPMANSDETFCRVGFPLKSIEKYIPTRLNYEAEDDKHLVITVALPQPQDGSEITYERLAKAVSEWKEAQPLKQPKDKKDSDPQEDPDREWLLAQVPREREFLADELGLQLHMGKLHIREIHQGVEFLGAFLKPYRDYVSNKTLERMTKKIQEINLRNEEKARRTIDSYLGILSHTASRHIAIDLGLASKPIAA